MLEFLQFFCIIAELMKYIHSDPEILGGTPVIKGTRIPIEVILYRLKDGYFVEEIQELYHWVDIKTLTGAIDEAIQTVATTLHV
jgi:uncharacterized protein (DUF433 family)